MSDSPAPDPHASDSEMAGLVAQAEAAWAEGRHADGLEAAQLAARLADERLAEGGALPSVLQARAWALQSLHQWRLGRFEDAALSARRALVGWESLGDTAACCDTHCLLATSFTELGLHEEALRNAAAAFDLARRHGLAAQETQALNRLGICHERLGDPERGEQYLLRALAQARQAHDRHAELMALNNLAASGIGGYHLLSQRGENAAALAFLQRAQAHAQHAVDLVREERDAYRLAVVEGNLGEILSLLGDYGAAQALLDATLATARAQGYRAVELRTRYNLGEMRISQGRIQESLADLHATLDALRVNDHGTTRMRVHRALYRAYKALGRFEPALAHFEAYHTIEMQRAALQSQAQARLMVNRLDLDQAIGPDGG